MPAWGNRPTRRRFRNAERRFFQLGGPGNPSSLTIGATPSESEDGRRGEGPDAGDEPEETPFGMAIDDPAVLQALAQFRALSDAGSKADVSPEEARERDLFTKLLVEITCANQTFTMAAFENSGGNFNPMDYMAAQEKLTEDILKKYGITSEQYGEMSERWGADPDVIGDMTSGIMKCMMGAMGGMDE